MHGCVCVVVGMLDMRFLTFTCRQQILMCVCFTEIELVCTKFLKFSELCFQHLQYSPDTFLPVEPLQWLLELLYQILTDVSQD